MSRHATTLVLWTLLLSLGLADPSAADRRKKRKAAAPTPRVAAHTVAMDGELAFVGDSAGLLILDLSDPLRPRQRARLPLADGALRVLLDGDRVYAALGSHGVSVIDVTDRTEPVELTRFEPPGSVGEMVLHRGHLILAEDHHGLRVVDVGDPEAPRARTRMPSRGEIKALELVGDRLLTAEGDAGVRLIDVARPERPRELERLDGDRGARALSVDGGLLAVGLGRGGVRLRPFDGERAGAALATIEERAAGVLLTDGRLYVADGSRGVACFDVSNPRRPTLLSRVRTQRHPSTGHLVASGRSLLGAGGEGGMFWIDYGDPREPKLLLPRERPLRIRMPRRGARGRGRTIRPRRRRRRSGAA